MTTLRTLSAIRITLFALIILSLFFSSMGGISSVKAQVSLPGVAIVFVSRRIPNNGTLYMGPTETGSIPGVGPYSRFQVSAPGKLLVREADGSLRVLVDGANPTTASLNLIDVNAPDVSYDGTKIVFAGLVNDSYDTAPLTNPGAWRIYTINVDGTGLQQVTFSDQNNLDLSQFRNVGELFRKYDDFDPAWLPDGRIVFSSTRWPSFGQYGGVRTSNLHVVNADGTNLHRITSERNGAERPQVDPITGKIVYSRWWRNFRVATNNLGTVTHPQGGYIMKDGLLSLIHSQPPPNTNEVGGFRNLDRNTWHLATINPDGTGLAQWGGRSSSYFYGQIANHAYGGGFAPNGSFYANFFPMNNMTEAAGFGGIRYYQRGPNGYQAILGVTMRDDSTLPLVRYNPPSHGVYQGSYAAEPEVLPDGRLVISWAANIAQDYGLYMINPDGSGLTPLYDNPGTTELRARVIQPRSLPPIIPDQITQVPSLLPPQPQGPYDVDGTFTFQALNVYFNAPVDMDILSAMPVGSANTIRFFIDHQRWQQSGSSEHHDWPILMKEIPVNPDGSVTTSSPANVPLFEQVRTSGPSYAVPLTGKTVTLKEMGGAAHVAGMNFGRPGEVVRCVGCHAGHSMIPVPANPGDAQWTNLAPGARVRVSSLNSSLPDANGLIDRRVKMPMENGNQKFWTSQAGLAPNTQWVQLVFPVEITVRTVRLYNIPSTDSPIRVQAATVKLFSDSTAHNQVASNTSGALSENGTDVNFNSVRAKLVRIEFDAVNGNAAGLAEVEVIARGEEVMTNQSMSNGTDTTGVFRPSNGLLYLKNTNTTGFADVALNYGLGGDYPVVGDWNGDGTVTIGIYRNGSFYLRNSNTIGFAELILPFGQPGDQPVAGDWNGDGTDTIGVYRSSTGQFLLRNSNNAGGAEMSFTLGNAGDVGIAGDWDGDGMDTTGVFRPSNGFIFLKNTNATGFADVALNYGLPGDRPVTGDWNNDGIDSIGIFRNGIFYLRNSNTNGFADMIFGLGNPGDMPIAGNWDGGP